MKIKSIKFAPVIGFGYWYDSYKIMPKGGYAHNIVLPFLRIQIGEIFV